MEKARTYNILSSPAEIKVLTEKALNHLPPLGFDVKIKFQRIGQGEFENTKIGAVAQGPSHTLVVNTDWYETTSEQDIKYIIWHEMRHMYQWSQIEKLHNSQHFEETTNIISQWQNELVNYIKNTPETEERHMKQEMEIDAYAFALYMLFRYCADSNGTVNIGLPPVIEDELMNRVRKKIILESSPI